MRKKIIVGNWKMHKDRKETKYLVKELKKAVKKQDTKGKRVLIAPPFTSLESAAEKLQKSKIEVVAQNMHQAENGAFTGEISAKMLRSVGVKTVILGHSERRSLFGESDAVLAEKVTVALANKLEIIFCFGECLEDRTSEKHFSVVQAQLENALFHVDATSWSRIILAYEPVWAIGTGKTASPEQAQEMHAFIRSLLQKKYDISLAEATPILYGGSVKPANATEIFSKKDVDGGLVGGASLQAKDFAAIIQSA